MTAMERRGFAFLDRPSLPSQVELVQEAERLGYDTVWAAESRLVRDAFTVLGAFATATTRVRLGALVNSWTRGPALMALTVATLHELAPGRINLCIGPSWDPLAAKQGIRRHSPGIQLREHVTVVGRLLEVGEPVTFDGRVVKVHDLALDLGRGVPREPIQAALYVLGTDDETTRIGAEIADGVLLNGFSPPATTRRSTELVITAATQAGRQVGDVDRPQIINVAMADDDQTARDQARSVVALYLGQQSHFAAAAGVDPELARRLADAIGGWPARPGDLEEASRLVDDDLVDRLVVAGAAGRCRDHLERWTDEGATSVVIVPITENCGEICRAMAPSRP
jgi:5,10-methylenetetrahydromethanopterin reductase